MSCKKLGINSVNGHHQSDGLDIVQDVALMSRISWSWAVVLHTSSLNSPFRI